MKVSSSAVAELSVRAGRPELTAAPQEESDTESHVLRGKKGTPHWLMAGEGALVTLPFIRPLASFFRSQVLRVS